MGEPTAAEYSLRARGKQDRRPLASLSNKERGLKAALEVLHDGLSPTSARAKWLVAADSLRYYKSKLEALGTGPTCGGGLGSGGDGAGSVSKRAYQQRHTVFYAEHQTLSVE